MNRHGNLAKRQAAERGRPALPRDTWTRHLESAEGRALCGVSTGVLGTLGDVSCSDCVKIDRSLARGRKVAP